MIRAYYDAAYLLKLYWQEQGTPEAFAHSQTVAGVSRSLHGRAEFASASHRKLREGTATAEILNRVLDQFAADAAGGGIIWLPLTDRIMERVEQVFRTSAATVYLRAADAQHLACAAENGFTEIYSNDRHLLAAAPLFGLAGVNVIPVI